MNFLTNAIVRTSGTLGFFDPFAREGFEETPPCKRGLYFSKGEALISAELAEG